MKRLAIIGFAQDNCFMAGKIGVYTNIIIVYFEPEIWLRHGEILKSVGLKLWCVT
jgi:hypothetical protein